jgi:pyruvate dehydrogenase E1 component alpha subunit
MDGMDVLKVHAAVKEAAERARKEHRPSFIEAVTYRYKGHSMSDPATYRTKEELAEYKNQDPILILRSQMLAAKQISNEEFDKIDAECKQISNDAAQFAEDSPQPAVETLYQDVLV